MLYCIDKETMTVCKVKKIIYDDKVDKVIANAVNPTSGQPIGISIPCEDVIFFTKD